MSATEVCITAQGRTGENEGKEFNNSGSGPEGSPVSATQVREPGSESTHNKPIRTRRRTASQMAKARSRASSQISAEMIAADFATLTEAGQRLDEAIEEPSSEGATEEPKVTYRDVLMANWLRIRDKDGKLRPFTLNAAQRAYAANCTNRNIVVKARQLGITTYVAARFFVNCITRPGTLCVQVAHDQRSAQEIFRIVHRLLANLPARLRKGVLCTSHANVRQIVFPRLDSQYRVETAAGPNAGRGLTIHNLHCSEVARWPRDAAATLASLRAAVPPGGEIVLESTANGASGCFYDEWQRAEQTGYTRHFFPWWFEPSYERELEIVEFTGEELALMQQHQLTAEQIAFRREIRANFGQRSAEEYAEDAESCFVASSECLFDTEAIQKSLASAPKATEVRDNGRLVVYLPPGKTEQGLPKEYIVGVDPAGGGSEGDFACAQVIDRSTGMQCAELRGHFTPQEMAARVVALGREYNQALVAVERNNHGHAVLAHLTMGQPYPNLYATNGQLGWLTSAATRPRMLENFAAVLTAMPGLFASPRLLEECRTFVRRPDGSAAAANGAHDDTVMAMAIALAVRTEMVGRVAARSSLGVAVL